jgi:hypothetical protein
MVLRKINCFRFIPALLIALAFGNAACAVPAIEKAFATDARLDESQPVIVKYCVSCHPHKEFRQSIHEEKIKAKYAKATEGDTRFDCRQCHTYSKNWFFDVKRGTHRIKEG